MKEKDKKSTVSWIMEFAGTHKNEYVLSIVTATCGVVCSIVPYVIVYLFVIDWRMALASLATLILGLVAYMGMMIDYEFDYQNTIDKTKILNDTAVEYINGIEVIKAFGRAKSSYERFVIAAKEGASCYVEWMRKCNVFFSIAMILAPATMLTVLPIGGMLYKGGSLSAVDFIMIIVLAVGVIAPIITVM